MSAQIRLTKSTPLPVWVVMRQGNARLTRLLRECDVPAGPYVVLAAACAILVLKSMLMP